MPDLPSAATAAGLQAPRDSCAAPARPYCETVERRWAEREAAELEELKRLQIELAAGEPSAGTPTSELHGEPLSERLRWLALCGRELTLRARRIEWQLPQAREPLRVLDGDGEATAARATLKPIS